MESDQEIILQVEGKGYTLGSRILRVAATGAQCPWVVYLHGGKFTSQDWLNIEAPTKTVSLGWNFCALDFNYKMEGQHPRGMNTVLPGQLLQAVLTKLDIQKPVIIAPSLSGLVSLSYLCTGGDKASSKCSGYMPIAIVGVDEHAANFKMIDVPTVTVYGANDELVKPDNQLDTIANTYKRIIPNAGHPCYLDNPTEWFKILEEFLNKIKP